MNSAHTHTIPHTHTHTHHKSVHSIEGSTNEMDPMCALVFRLVTSHHQSRKLITFICTVPVRFVIILFLKSIAARDMHAPINNERTIHACVRYLCARVPVNGARWFYLMESQIAFNAVRREEYLTLAGQNHQKSVERLDPR